MYDFHMLKKIARGYKKYFSSAAKVLLLLAACTLLGAAIVYPLWFFATSSPVAYTITTLIIIALILSFLLIKKIKKAGITASLLTAARILTVILGLYAAIELVLHGKRFLALPVLFLMIIVYGVLTFGREKK